MQPMSLQYHAVHVTERAATERFGGACTVDLWFFSLTYVRHALSASHAVCARRSTPSRHGLVPQIACFAAAPPVKRNHRSLKSNAPSTLCAV